MAVDSGPSRRAVALTPHATNAQPVGRGIHVGVGGDIVGQLADDTTDSTFTLAGGMTHPYAFKYIRVTGTTATGLLAIF